MKAGAAIFREAHAPLTIEEIELDEPRGREVLVRTVAVGVCHSDYHLLDGSRSGGPYPTVPGHEVAGVVQAVGEQVTAMKVGDHVVGCISGFCGVCEQCLSGHPNVCVAGATNRSAELPPRLSQNGKPLEQFFGIGGYAEYLLLHENSLVAIDPDLALDRAALVGCAVLSGVGSVLRTAEVRPEHTMAVFGCGGVGLSVIQGGIIAGARQIIAVDIRDSKLAMAKHFGATHVINSTENEMPATLRELTGGRGVDHVFECVGAIPVIAQASECMTIRGTLTIVGVPPTGSRIEIPWSAIRPECRVQTSRMGSNRFRQDIPAYLEFYRQGRLNLDDLITRRARLEDINEAFEAMEGGEVARTVLMFD
jgi:S-(hydroxymethyl)glutathione dehydrogenase/alcohol dehydrogenase